MARDGYVTIWCFTADAEERKDAENKDILEHGRIVKKSKNKLNLSHAKVASSKKNLLNSIYASLIYFLPSLKFSPTAKKNQQKK